MVAVLRPRRRSGAGASCYGGDGLARGGGPARGRNATLPARHARRPLSLAQANSSEKPAHRREPYSERRGDLEFGRFGWRMCQIMKAVQLSGVKPVACTLSISSSTLATVTPGMR